MWNFGLTCVNLCTLSRSLPAADCSSSLTSRGHCWIAKWLEFSGSDSVCLLCVRIRRLTESVKAGQAALSFTQPAPVQSSRGTPEQAAGSVGLAQARVWPDRCPRPCLCVAFFISLLLLSPSVCRRVLQYTPEYSAHRGERRVLNPQKLKLQIIVSCRVGAGSGAWALPCKSSNSPEH